jgi:ATP-dependent DNA ligase
MPSRVKASFVAPMLLQPTEKLPENRDRWMYELKLDGYRAIAYKTGGTLRLRSRNNKDFDARYPAVVRGLAGLPNETVIDGEIVALDDSGRPSFSALQNYGSPSTPVVYYVFDVMVVAGRNVMAESLEARRRLLRRRSTVRSSRRRYAISCIRCEHSDWKALSRSAATAATSRGCDPARG